MSREAPSSTPGEGNERRTEILDKMAAEKVRFVASQLRRLSDAQIAELQEHGFEVIRTRKEAVTDAELVQDQLDNNGMENGQLPEPEIPTDTDEEWG